MPTRTHLLALIATTTVSFAGVSRAVVLYDASAGSDPTAQGLSYGSLPLTSFYTSDASGTMLNTSASNTTYAGFTNSSPITLDPAVGFDVRVDAKLIASAATNTSRAGFSIIALGSDKHGIELGFHGNEIFAQDDGANLFVRAEAVAIDTTAALTRYDVAITGNTYTLSANGTTILSGPTRDYSTFTGLINPYTTPNFLFFGDDSTSASGTTLFSHIEVQTPEPATLAGVAGVVSLALRRRR